LIEDQNPQSLSFYGSGKWKIVWNETHDLLVKQGCELTHGFHEYKMEATLRSAKGWKILPGTV
jgi:hypothetical protein